MTVVSALTWFSGGLALGAAYLFCIALSVRAISKGDGWRAAVLPLVLRILLATAAFLTASRFGAVPVLLMLAGFLSARSIGLRRFAGH